MGLKILYIKIKLYESLNFRILIGIKKNLWVLFIGNCLENNISFLKCYCILIGDYLCFNIYRIVIKVY